MAIKGTLFFVDDNSGAKTAEVIGIPGNSVTRAIQIGQKVKVAVKKVLPNGKIKSGAVYDAIVTRLRKNIVRKDGTISRAQENGLVLVDPKNEPVGTSILSIVAREIRDRFPKIASLAKGVY